MPFVLPLLTRYMDFYLRVAWEDPRINFEDMFAYLNPECTANGLDITT